MSKGGLDVSSINQHKTRVDDVMIKVGLTQGDSTKQTPNAMDDWKSNQLAENELDGIIVTQRQWRTHPFDMNVKRMPSFENDSMDSYGK